VSEWTSSDGTRIAYRRSGKGPGTILVHGGFIDGSSMAGLVEELSSSRTAVAPDRRGHGASSPYTGPHSFADDVSDLVGLSHHLTDELGEEVELVGHSAGCHVALAAASTAPVSRVVLWEPPDFQAKRVSPQLWDKIHAATAKGDRRGVVRLLLNDVIGASTGMHIPWFAFPFLFRSQFGKVMLANALAAPTELAAFEDRQWRPEHLATVTVPVYPLVGSTSPPFNRRFADFVAEHVPGTRVQIVEGGKHATPTDNPKAFAAVLADLRQREPNSDQAKD
jgi:pimeloyl-ACP methyl ester carboxylesterase